MKKNIYSIILSFFLLFGFVPMQVFAGEVEEEDIFEKSENDGLLEEVKSDEDTSVEENPGISEDSGVDAELDFEDRESEELQDVDSGWTEDGDSKEPQDGTLLEKDINEEFDINDGQQKGVETFPDDYEEDVVDDQETMVENAGEDDFAEISEGLIEDEAEINDSLLNNEDISWQEDFEYEKGDGFITITKYIDDAVDLIVRSNARIDGEDYSVKLSGNVFLGNECLKTIQFEEGVELYGDCTAMFGAKNVESIDLRGVSTKNVTDMSGMFGFRSDKYYEYIGGKLVSLELGDDFDTGNVRDMGCMFQGCENLKNIDLGDKFDTSNVTSMVCMFAECMSLTSLDLGEKFNTSNVTNMLSMFHVCESLVSLNLGDKFDTSNVIYMDAMFADCKSLNNFDFLNKFNTSNVTSMSEMFRWCENIVSLDLRAFDTHNVRDVTYMFGNCPRLKYLDLSSFDFSNVKSTYSFIYYGVDELVELKTPKVGNANISIELWRSMYEKMEDGTLRREGYKDLMKAPLNSTIAVKSKTNSFVPIGYLENMTVLLETTEYTYDGFKKCPGVTVKKDDEVLERVKDYMVEYSNNVDVGTATVEVSGRRDYAGSKEVSFVIKAAKISDCTFSSIPDQTHTGKSVEPKPVLSVGGKNLILGKDYTLSYKNNTNAGTATVIATGKGNYTGTTQATFKIVGPKKTAQKISKVSAKSAQILQGKTTAVNVSGSNLKGQKVFLSSNPKVAIVNSSGVVTAKSPGTAVISVYVKATGNYLKSNTAKCVVTVKPIAVKSIKLNRTSASIKRGRTIALKAIINPSNATNKAVTWKSSNKKIATVTSKGKVKGVKKGKAKIAVLSKDGKKKAVCMIVVK